MENSNNTEKKFKQSQVEKRWGIEYTDLNNTFNLLEKTWIRAKAYRKESFKLKGISFNVSEITKESDQRGEEVIFVRESALLRLDELDKKVIPSRSYDKREMKFIQPVQEDEKPASHPHLTKTNGLAPTHSTRFER